tara:strand:- start:119238 stop:124442 length:5205 start_codon:yes stop_codon:yes gene_type:complete
METIKIEKYNNSEITNKNNIYPNPDVISGFYFNFNANLNESVNLNIDSTFVGNWKIIIQSINGLDLYINEPFINKSYNFITKNKKFTCFIICENYQKGSRFNLIEIKISKNINTETSFQVPKYELNFNNLLSKKLVSIILLCYNHWNYTKRCIDSILKNTTKITYELIIVNNNSTDETKSELEKLSNDIRIVNNNKNLNFSGGMNSGVKIAKGEYIVLLNNDTYCFDNWLSPLIELLEKNKELGIVTPITNRSGNESRVYIKHNNLMDYYSKVKNIRFVLKDYESCDRAGLFCGAMRKKEFEEVGMFDENYVNGWEDDDLSEKYKLRGYKIGITYNSIVYHYGNVTVGQGAYSKKNTNREYFENKWNKKWKSAWKSIDDRFIIDSKGNLKFNIAKEKCINKNVYIIGKDIGGGGSKYVNDLLKYYKNYNFIRVTSNGELKKIEKNSIVMFQHVLFTDIEIENLVDIIKNKNFEHYFCIHDFMWLNDKVQRKWEFNCHANYISFNGKINKNIYELMKLSKMIIHPSKFTKKIYEKYFVGNHRIISHIDFSIYQENNFSMIKDNTIRIGILHSYSEYKGFELIEAIYNKYNNCKIGEYIIKILRINYELPKYDEIEFFDIVDKYHINGFMLLNKWGETWSYYLTKILLSGLPFIYNNFGAFKERITSNSHYKVVYNNESEFGINNKLFNEFENLIEYISSNKSQEKKLNLVNKNLVIKSNQYYDSIFNTEKYKFYPIYFPQFHDIKENNLNFYDGYNDIKNLKLLKDTVKNHTIETLDYKQYNLDKIEDYNLSNKAIIDKQIELAKKYDISGFGIYYYWFSKNTITNKNEIMEKCYDNFFKNPYTNFNVFFVWANENWTSNPAFGSNLGKIETEYNDLNIKLFANNLIRYFKHPNYLKINNKPLIMIHHPFLIENNKLKTIQSKLNEICINIGFSGVELYLNSLNGINNSFKNYSFHPNYKKSDSFINRTDGQRIIDYKDYLDKLPEKMDNDEFINTIYFDFDNRARLIKPDRIKLSTICDNNNYKNQVEMSLKCLNSFQSESNNIVLFNAWNEWGEKMALEPSEQKGHMYLNIIKNLKIMSQYHKFTKKLLINNEKLIPIKYIPYNEIEIKKRNICHIHCYDINKFELYFNQYLDNIKNYFDIIITYSIGDKEINNVICLKVENKGMDIGGKFCCVNYLSNKNIQYDNILFLHSKSDEKMRNKYFSPLIKSLERIKLIIELMNTKFKNIGGIFPDIIHDGRINKEKTDGNNYYLNEFTNFYKLDNYDKVFVEGNVMILKKEISEYLFNNNSILLYNLLNNFNSYDYSWCRYKYKKYMLNEYELYEYVKNNNLSMNTLPLKGTSEDLPDTMIEHSFERLYISVIKKLNYSYITLPSDSIVKYLNIKINSIYFPQFYNSEHNNKFWGNGFTEWTKLKPYDDNFEIDNKKYSILKPQNENGYYKLDTPDHLYEQIKKSKNNNLNGFMIYHYWFYKEKNVLSKPKEYFLRDDINYPFFLSWANEPWTKRWDGSDNEVLLEQQYGDYEDYVKHIQYLIKFFKKDNYIKNKKGECIFYIYNYQHIKNHIDKMVNIWKNELVKYNIKIKVILTENGDGSNHSISNYDKYLFEPLHSLVNTKIKKKYINNKNWMCNLIDYELIIKKYKNKLYSNKDYGFPLYWNNIVRRKNLPVLMVENFSIENLKELFIVIIVQIIINKNNNFESMININAWNEWNEQATLEDTNIYGDNILKEISNLIKNV